MNKFDLKAPIICEDIKELTSLMELFGYDVDELKTTYSLLSKLNKTLAKDCKMRGLEFMYPIVVVGIAQGRNIRFYNSEECKIQPVMLKTMDAILFKEIESLKNDNLNETNVFNPQNILFISGNDFLCEITINFIYGEVKKIKCKTYEEYRFFIGNFKSKWI